MNTNHLETDQDKDQIIASLQSEIDTLKAVIAMMPGNVYWQNQKGEYLGCNNNMAKTFNLSSPDELIGKTNASFMDQELLEYITNIDNEVLTTKKEKRLEETGFDSHGHTAIYLTQKTPLFDRHGNIQGILGISLDITARKHIEDKLKIAKQKAEAANRAKSKFLAMISHELRTPLTSILGFVNFLQQENLAEQEKKQFIQHIINSGSYLFSLINNLLDYNKLEADKYELITAPINLKNLIDDVMNMSGGMTSKKNIHFSVEYDTTAPEYVICDSRVLRQILVNLLGNAVKFTEQGYVKVIVKCIATTENSTELQIAVEDSGIGIDENHQRSVFKRFHQLGNVYTRNNSLTGTGLGLTIVKKLVKLLGSKIELISELNKGSTFYFTAHFPTVNPVSQQETSPKESSSKTLITQKIKALLIEDDALIQIVHRQMLEVLDCEVDIADCAETALSMLKNSYDVIFVDIGLPDMSGFELINLMKQKHLRSHPVPIIALTGYSEEEEKQKCLAAGANEVAVKPISKVSLGRLLERYFAY